MRRPLLSLVAASVALALGTPAALSHGGQYRGPAGEVPPDSRQPEDPPPPDTGGGTSTPPDNGGGTPTPPETGGGGTTTPPDGERPPAPPPPPTDPGPGPGTGPGTVTRRGPVKRPVSFDSWLFWWGYNREGILAPRTRTTAAVSGFGQIGRVLEGASGNESRAVDLTARVLEREVVPLLEEYARDDGINFDIQSAAILGLAKMGRKDLAPLLMEIARNGGRVRRHVVVEESAALALGILQDRSPQVRAFLAALAADRSAATRTRCFASISLGLLGGPDAAADANAEALGALIPLVEGDEASGDIAASALVGIGLLGDPAAIPTLIRWLDEERAGRKRLDDLTLSHVAAALGRIGRPGIAGPDSREVLDALRDVFRRRRRLTRYSAVIALGQVAPQGDERIRRECVTMLGDVVASEGRGGVDVQAVNFALIALGRIAAVSGTPDAVRARAMRFLGETLEEKGRSAPFAALGIGLAGLEANEAERLPLAERVRGILARTRGDVEARGAHVLTLGLLRDAPSVPLLVATLDDRGEDSRIRGTAAVALGLVGDRGAALEPVRRALRERSDRQLRVDAAEAATLLRDGEAVDLLLEILRESKGSQLAYGSAALALGRIGDARAVEPLARILRDEKGQYPDLTRALAAVALGQIGDRSEVPVLSRISEDVNYRAQFPALAELLTIL